MAIKVVTIVGARPQFVKAAVVSRVFRQHSDVEEILVHTGQHHDASMSDAFFQEMRIPTPAHHLGVAGGTHGAMTGRMLEKIEQVLLQEKPDWVLVYGDTNSTLAGALAAAKLHIPLVHVEAGLRSFNRRMPEEVNRVLTDQLSTKLFCPTDTAVKNLEREGITQGVVRTGDVMADAFYFYKGEAQQAAKLFRSLPEKPYALATLHRAENTDDDRRLRSIIQALETLNRDMPVYLPLHPRTRSKLASLGLNLRLQTLEPIGYYDMLQLLSGASLVLTDSGGLQKEAYLAEKPCITFRDETEWVELVEAGVNQVVGTESHAILTAALAFKRAPPTFVRGLYGEGNAGEQIVAAMLT
jgi:UDP-GlcNAc3NAcA epimerase